MQNSKETYAYEDIPFCLVSAKQSTKGDRNACSGADRKKLKADSQASFKNAREPFYYFCWGALCWKEITHKAFLTRKSIWIQFAYLASLRCTNLIRSTKVTTSSIMMKNGGWMPGQILEPSCLVENMVEIMPVSQVSLGKST